MSRDPSFPLLLLCFFLSGLAALVYETAWTREFALVFGTSELAVATVLAAYMGGLAAGAALAGRLAPRISRPLWAYGLLELGIALAALAVPFAIGASRALYVALFGGQGALADATGGNATAVFYLVCSFLILLAPTGMMGATLPLLARHAVLEEDQLGRRIGLLYGINTAGAVAGTLIAAYVLLPDLGLRATIGVAAAVNAGVFCGAWALARRAAPVRGAVESASTSPDTASATWILPLVFVSGGVSFSYEVLWVRLLAHVVGGSTQAFATMLASFLGGIALGSTFASRFASSRRGAALGFALAQIGVAALSLAAFAVVDRIPEASRLLQERGLSRSLVDAVSCMLTLFPAALCIGATFPFAVRVFARRSEDAGPASARVYAASTLGSIVGAVGAGFALVPGLGFAGAVAACAAVNLALAAAAALLADRRRTAERADPRRPALVVAAVAGGFALVLAPPATPWSMLRTTPASGRSEAGTLEYFAVGRTASVLLIDRVLSWRLWTNGLPEASIQRPGIWPHRQVLTRWLSALPVLARPETRTLLVVGLGGGAALELVPATVERIDVVEIEPEVIEANRAVAERRWRDPLADPRVHLHVNDARNALLLATREFDGIVSQPSHPWTGGAAHLYTQEFFELVRSRLSPHGVFVQWIGLEFVDAELFRSLLAALDAVFPNVRVYAPRKHGVLFLASRTSLDVERSAPRALRAAPGAFAALGIRSPEQVSAQLVLDETGVRALAQGAAPNRDGHNRLRSGSARLGPRSLSMTFGTLVAPHDPLLASRPPDEDFLFLLRNLDPARARRVADALADPLERKVARALTGMAAGAREGPRALLLEALAEAPRHEEARAALLRLSVRRVERGDGERLLEPPLSDAERAVTAGWRARELDDGGEALRALEPSLAEVPLRHPLQIEATRLRIRWRLRSGEPERVREAIALADESLGWSPDPASLLLRAQAYVAAEEHAAVLDTLELVGARLDRSSSVSAAYLLHARELLRATPRRPELAWLRGRAERKLDLRGPTAPGSRSAR